MRISFQLDGVPIDTTPFQRRADQIAPGTDPYFRPRSTASTSFIRFGTPLPLDVLATVVEKDQREEPGEWVLGVVARNPFFSDRDRLVELGVDPLDLGAALEENELLICDLRSWHLAREHREYVLTRLDFASTSDVVVLRPIADWDPADRPPTQNACPHPRT